MKHVAGVDLRDGEVRWKIPFPGKTAVIPTPIFQKDQVFVAAGYKVGCLSARLGFEDEPQVLYQNTDMVNHHGGVILHGDQLYGYSDGGGWTCMEFATGKVVWAEKKALGKGAIHYCDGRFILLEESSGTVVMIDASADGWKERGRFVLEAQSAERSPQGKIWTHPVVANGHLYLRDQERLSCYDVSAP
ncbi:MAG: PQQ-binding-like beta-propeller repeat protein [Verrucomicrobiales bacterium]|nr:PQQ-binding-like beta-propeller repeat protein [Verrucomicrobiales bacterium]